MGIDPLECQDRDAYEDMCEMYFITLECGHSIPFDGSNNFYSREHYCPICKELRMTDSGRRDIEEKYGGDPHLMT